MQTSKVTECSAQLQIGSATVRIDETFKLGEGEETVEQRLGIAIGQAISCLRGHLAFDTAKLLDETAKWAQFSMSTGSREMREEADLLQEAIG